MAPTSAFSTTHVYPRAVPFPVVLLVLALTLALGLSIAHAQMYRAVPSYQNPGTATWASWAAPSPSAVGIVDFAGNPRVQGNNIDIGDYEQ